MNLIHGKQITPKISGLGLTLSNGVMSIVATNYFTFSNGLLEIDSSKFILQNGNIFGTTSSIGTNDNYPLQLKTNNIVALTIGTNGNISTDNNTTTFKINVVGTGKFSDRLYANGLDIYGTVSPIGADYFHFDNHPNISATENNQIISLIRLRHRGSDGAYTGVIRPLLTSENIGGGQHNIQLYEYGLRIGNYTGGQAAFKTPIALFEGLGFSQNTDLINIKTYLNESTFVLNGYGNLSLGGTTSNYKLDVISATAISARFDGRVIGVTAVNNNEFITLGQFAASASKYIFQNGNSFGLTFSIGTNDNYPIQLKTNNTVALTILPNGRIGIGTASPAYALDVVSHIRIKNGGLYIDYSQPFINFRDTSGSVLTQMEHLIYGTGTSFNITTQAAASIGFLPNGQQTMFIKADRTVTIGTSPLSYGKFNIVGFGTTSATYVLYTIDSNNVKTSSLSDNGDFYLLGSITTTNLNLRALTASQTDLMIISSTGSVGRTSSNVFLSGNYFSQNGNSFGATAVLGTNDNYGLQFETNNNKVLTIGTNGYIGINSESPTDMLEIKASSLNRRFVVGEGNTAFGGLAIERYSNNPLGADEVTIKKSRGFYGSVSAVLSGDLLGSLQWNGGIGGTATDPFVPSTYISTYVNDSSVISATTSFIRGDIYLGSFINNTATLILRSNLISDFYGIINLNSLTASQSDIMIISPTGSVGRTSSTVFLSGNYFAQNGNSFGATAVLGTTDNQNLQITTNAIERLLISNNGTFSFNTFGSASLFTTSKFIFRGDNPVFETTGSNLSFALSAYNNFTNMSANTIAAQIDMVGYRNNSTSTIARIRSIYQGDGTNRTADLVLAVGQSNNVISDRLYLRDNYSQFTNRALIIDNAVRSVTYSNIYSLEVGGGVLFTSTLQLSGITSSQTDIMIISPTGSVNRINSTLISVGTASFALNAAFANGVTWSTITNKPTTLTGYGITDAVLYSTASYNDPSWLVTLAGSRITGTVGTASYAVYALNSAFANGVTWSTITNTPTTLSGYGITDAVLYSTASYNDPSWLVTLAGSKITGTVGTAAFALNAAFANGVTWSTITLKPTTLSGYGITDAFAQNGNSFGTTAVLGTNDNNALIFETNNISRLTIGTNGYIGIGTSSPIYNLDVVGISRYTNNVIVEGTLNLSNLTAPQIDIVIISATGSVGRTSSNIFLANNYFAQNGNSFGTTAILGTNDNQNLQFETNGITRLTIATSGNVGFGNSNPLYTLDVIGGGRFTNTLYTDVIDIFGGFLNLGWNAATNSNFIKVASGDNRSISIGASPISGGSGWINFITNGLQRMVVTKSGNVGIGTPTPSEKLHIEGNVYVSGSLLIAGTTTQINTSNLTVTDAIIELSVGQNGLNPVLDSGFIINRGLGGSGSTANVGFIWKEDSDEFVFIGTSNTASVISVTISNYENIRARSLKLDSGISIGTSIYITQSGNSYFLNGNFGIGTSSPTHKLHISGNVLVESNVNFIGITGTQSDLMIISSTGSVGRTNSSVFLSNSLTQSYFAQNGNSFGVTASLGTNDNQSLQLKSNNISVLTIATNGYVGIGTSSPMWDLTIVKSSSGTGIHVLNGNTSGILVSRYSSGAGAGFTTQKFGGSIATPSAVSNSEALGRYQANAWDGTASQVAGYLHFISAPISAGTISNTNLPSEAAILLNAGGSTNNIIERIRFTYDGKVGIGTITPSYTLDIVSGTSISARFDGRVIGATAVNSNEFITLGQLAASAASTYFMQGGNSFGATALLGTNDNQNLQFETNGVVRLTIATSGNVGIGANIPIEKLDVVGNIRTSQFSEIYSIGSTLTRKNYRLYTHTTLDIGMLDLERAGVVNVHLSSDYIGGGHSYINAEAGNLGLGTTNPVEKLHLNGNQRIGLNGDSGYYISWGQNEVASTGDFARIQALRTTATGNQAGHLIFLTKEIGGGTTPTERLRITDNGFIGIGQTSPSYSLDVTSTYSIVARFSGRVIGVTAINSNEYITLGQLASSASNYFIQNGNSFGTTAILGTNDNNDLLLETNATNRVIISRNGNIGFGATATSTYVNIRNISTESNILSVNNNANNRLLNITNDQTVSFTLNNNGSAPFNLQNTGSSRQAIIGNLEITSGDNGWGSQQYNIGAGWMRWITGHNLTMSNVYSFQGLNYLSNPVGSTWYSTSGNLNFFEISSNDYFSPTYGNATFNILNISGGVAQTGTASGITRALYINPSATGNNFKWIETSGTSNPTSSVSNYQSIIFGHTINAKTHSQTLIGMYLNMNITSTYSNVNRYQLYSNGIVAIENNIGGGSIQLLGSNRRIHSHNGGGGNEIDFSLSGFGQLNFRPYSDYNIYHQLAATTSINLDGRRTNLYQQLNLLYSISNDTDLMIISSTGSVGRTSSNIFLANSLTQSYFAQNGNSYGATAVLGTNDNYGLEFETNNTKVLTIATNGYVSIGTNSRTTKLHVKTTELVPVIRASDTFYDYYIGYGDVGNTQNNNYWQLYRNSSITIYQNSSGSHNFNIGTISVMSIDSNVGIGTIIPSYKLDVISGVTISARFDGRVIGATAINNDEFITLGQLTSSTNNYFLQNGNTFGATAVLGTNDNQQLNIKVNGTSSLLFGTNSTAYFFGAIDDGISNVYFRSYNRSYAFKATDSVWLTSINQNSSISGVSGVGRLEFYNTSSIALNVYGYHDVSSILRTVEIRRQDLTYALLSGMTNSSHPNPNLIIRSSNTSGNNYACFNVGTAVGLNISTYQDMIRLSPANILSMVIATNGYIAIGGMTTPTHLLDISTASSIKIRALNHTYSQSKPVYVDSTGVLTVANGTASANPMLITDPTVIAALIDDVNNWDVNGNWIGGSLNAFAGQYYRNIDWFFFMYADSDPMRMIRG